jgi:hypothetical protein
MSDDSMDDPVALGFKAVQFGNADDPEDVGKFRRAVQAEVANTRFLEREQEETKRNQATLAKLYEDNPDLKEDKAASAAVERHCFDLMEADLAKHNLTPEGFKQAFGRDRTPADVAALHLKLRAHHPGSVKSAEEWMRQAVENYRDWRRGQFPSADGREHNGPDRDFTAAARTRLNEARGIRRESKLGDDYGTTPAPGADPETARASSVVQAMKAQRQAQKATSLRDIIIRRAG